MLSWFLRPKASWPVFSYSWLWPQLVFTAIRISPLRGFGASFVGGVASGLLSAFGGLFLAAKLIRFRTTIGGRYADDSRTVPSGKSKEERSRVACIPRHSGIAGVVQRNVPESRLEQRAL